MNDTDRSFAKLVHQKMMERSPEDRMRMGSDMHESARALVMASFPLGLSPSRKRYQLFLRFYNRDFNEVEKANIRKREEQLMYHTL